MSIATSPAIRQAYTDYTASVRVRNSKVACMLVIALMPAGFLLDYFVYRDRVPDFLRLRLLCSALTLAVLVGLMRPELKKFHGILGAGWYLLPSFFISWMIAMQQGAVSPYYAGLSLVILAVSSVVQATFKESLIAVSSIFMMYAAACVLHGRIDSTNYLFNNIYFLVLTAMIVVTGNYFYNELRYREFCLRYELDESRAKLQENHQKLVELDQIKSRFFANISHELRTPLTLLLAPLEAILTKHQHHLDAEITGHLRTMQGNGMRLLKLINDLLDLVKLESGKMEVRNERIDLPEFVRGLLNSLSATAEDKGVKLQLDSSPDLRFIGGDRNKLEKVLLNLVFNSLKFTPAGGLVSIHAAKSGNELQLVVKDTGMGISESQLPYIFHRFWQADSSSSRKYQGTGIGLALVKELVEVQGGRVEATSSPGHGTSMTVMIPFREAPEPVEPAPSGQIQITDPESGGLNQDWLGKLYRRAELFPSITALRDSVRPAENYSRVSKKKILVADDEPDMLRFLRGQLSDHYEVIEATDGQQALEKAAQFLPELVVLDMMMPEKDGLEVCRELRQKTATQNIPIILLTARADEDTKLSALSAGANDFLAKPFSTTELHVRTKNLVESHDLQHKLSWQNKVLESTLEELKETESQLVQSEKMASLGRMSAGIIHEINNPLNFCKTGLYALKNRSNRVETGFQEQYLDIIKDIEEGVDRVKTIVSDLRTFTHPNTEHFDQVPLAKMLESALRFLATEWKDKVEITIEIEDNQTVLVNANKLLQVLVNLIQNALDALKDKNFVDSKPAIRIQAVTEGEKVLLRIRDNGEGISPENMSKIFDPFFTTKDVGQGMGLGLSICYRIVQECGGRIYAKSEVGKFCEFTLEFPKEAPVRTNEVLV